MAMACCHALIASGSTSGTILHGTQHPVERRVVRHEREPFTDHADGIIIAFQLHIHPLKAVKICKIAPLVPEKIPVKVRGLLPLTSLLKSLGQA